MSDNVVPLFPEAYPWAGHEQWLRFEVSEWQGEFSVVAVWKSRAVGAGYRIDAREYEATRHLHLVCATKTQAMIEAARLADRFGVSREDRTDTAPPPDYAA